MGAHIVRIYTQQYKNIEFDGFMYHDIDLYGIILLYIEVHVMYMDSCVSILDPGPCILDPGCRTLDPGSWTQDPGSQSMQSVS